VVYSGFIVRHCETQRVEAIPYSPSMTSYTMSGNSFKVIS
jgi:hypothetical protein